MFRGFIVCPHAMSSIATSNASASFSRSAGLGVQRPEAMASTRCVGRPLRLGDFFDRPPGLFQQQIDGLHGAGSQRVNSEIAGSERAGDVFRVDLGANGEFSRGVFGRTAEIIATRLVGVSAVPVALRRGTSSLLALT